MAKDSPTQVRRRRWPEAGSALVAEPATWLGTAASAETDEAALIAHQLAQLDLPAQIRDVFWRLAGSARAPGEFDSTTYFDEMSGTDGDVD
jgi:hypothetical protein